MNQPAFVLSALERVAMCSPCAKSKRAAVVFDPLTQKQWGVGYNTLPKSMVCDGSAACRRDCAKLCMHAESMAIHAALVHHTAANGVGPDGVGQLAGLHMLHVKVVDGVIVAGGPPSCWQCSREILEHDLAGMWLYEISEDAPEREVDTFLCADCGYEELNPVGEPVQGDCFNCSSDNGFSAAPVRKVVGAPEWRFYTAEEFHRTTLKNCGLHIGDLPAATHVLWGGRALCAATYLNGVPGGWPAGQTWLSLADVAKGDINDLVTCRTCRINTLQYINGLKQIGAWK